MTNLSGEHLPEYLPVNRAEKIDDIRLKIELVALRNEIMYALNGRADSPALDEREAAVEIKSLKGGLNEKGDCLHYDPVSYGGDLQGSRFLRSRFLDCMSAKFIEDVRVGP